jgi:hypothetical protein
MRNLIQVLRRSWGSLKFGEAESVCREICLRRILRTFGSPTKPQTCRDPQSESCDLSRRHFCPSSQQLPEATRLYDELSASVRFQNPSVAAILNLSSRPLALDFAGDARALQDDQSYNMIARRQCDPNSDLHKLLCYLYIAFTEYSLK